MPEIIFIRIGELPAELARKAGLDEFRVTVRSTKITNPQNPPADQDLPTVSSNPEETESVNRIEPPANGEDRPA